MFLCRYILADQNMPAISDNVVVFISNPGRKNDVCPILAALFPNDKIKINLNIGFVHVLILLIDIYLN